MLQGLRVISHMAFIVSHFYSVVTGPSEMALIRQKIYSNVTVQGPCNPIKKFNPSRISIKIVPKYAE